LLTARIGAAAASVAALATTGDGVAAVSFVLDPAGPDISW